VVKKSLKEADLNRCIEMISKLRIKDISGK